MIPIAFIVSLALAGAPAAPSPSPSPAGVIADASHDGSDTGHAIVVTAVNQKLGVAAELAWLYKQSCGTNGHWTIQKQTSIETATNYYDQLDVQCNDAGQANHTYFFDVTSFFGKT